MDGLYACPKCGRPDSAWGDQFCGKCEAEYQQEQYQYKQDEINRLNQEMNNCSCHGDEPCCDCYRRLAQICSLQGKEAEAEYWFNH